MTLSKYHVIDKAKLLVHYFYRMTFYDVTYGNCIELQNVMYCFDENLELKEVKVFDNSKQAYILTTEGFLKWNPPYMIRLFRGKEFLRFSKYGLTPRLYYYHGITPICLSYVCLEEPKNATRIEKENFWSKSKSEIIEREDELIFDFEESIGWEIGISLGKSKIGLVRARDIKKLVLTRGTCFSINTTQNAVVCY